MLRNLYCCSGFLQQYLTLSRMYSYYQYSGHGHTLQQSVRWKKRVWGQIAMSTTTRSGLELTSLNVQLNQKALLSIVGYM